MREALVWVWIALAGWIVPLQSQQPVGPLVDSIARQVLQATGAPSASVAVVQDGRLVYAQAYGSAQLEPPVAARAEMRYSIGSISKQFTATAVLMLAEDGKLSLDDKVARYLPQLTRAGDVTIRQLLSHTSGYRDYWPQDYVPPFMLQPVTAERILDQWARKPLDFEPGAQWQYSNTGYVIAGLIVVFLLGYWGTKSAGIFEPREAFFVIGASIIILSAASVYQFLTLRNSMSVLKIHEEELQSARDTAQEKRISSLESTLSGMGGSIGPRVAALEPQLASLETRVTTLERRGSYVGKTASVQEAGKISMKEYSSAAAEVK